jgi:hypothetical protein
MRMISRAAVKMWLESISEQQKSDAPHANEQANMQMEMAREDLLRGFSPLRDPDTGRIMMDGDSRFYETVNDFVCAALFALRETNLAEANHNIDAALAWIVQA